MMEELNKILSSYLLKKINRNTELENELSNKIKNTNDFIKKAKSTILKLKNKSED